MHIQTQQSAKINSQARPSWRVNLRARLCASMLLLAFVFAAFGPTLMAVSEGEWATTTIAAEGEGCRLGFGDTGKDIIGVVQADGSCKPKANIDEPSEIAKTFSQLAIFVSGILVAVVSFQSIIIGELMGNELIMGNAWKSDTDTLDIQVLLQSFWRIIRDLVNYAFIIVLLVIAFMTVITAGGGVMGAGDGFKVGQVLPKFVVAVVLVNFTWFGARVVLDAANIAAHVVYGIPASMTSYLPAFNDTLTNCTAWDYKDPADPLGIRKNTPCIYRPTEIKFDKSTFDADAPPDHHKFKNEHAVVIFENTPIKWENIDQSTIASIFAFGIFNVSQIPMAIGTARSLSDLTINGIAAFMVMVILIVVFTAMALVLLERLVMLWLHIVLAPLGVLFWVLSSAFGTGAPGEQLSLGKFISYAFLPAAMGVPLVLGLMMVIVGGQMELVDDSKVIISGIDTFTGFKGIQDFQQLLWFVIALAVMWQAMSVGEKMTSITNGIIGGMKNQVEGFGKFVASTPLYAQWLPVKTGSSDKGSVMNFAHGYQGLMSGRDSKSRERARELFGGDSSSPEQRKIIGGADKRQIEQLLEALNSGKEKWSETTLATHLTGLKPDQVKELMKGSQEDVVTLMLDRTNRSKTGNEKALGKDTPPSAPPPPSTKVEINAGTGAAPTPFNLNVTTSVGQSPEQQAAAVKSAVLEARSKMRDLKIDKDDLEKMKAAGAIDTDLSSLVGLLDKEDFWKKTP